MDIIRRRTLHAPNARLEHSLAGNKKNVHYADQVTTPPPRRPIAHLALRDFTLTKVAPRCAVSAIVIFFPLLWVKMGVEKVNTILCFFYFSADNSLLLTFVWFLVTSLFMIVISLGSLLFGVPLVGLINNCLRGRKGKFQAIELEEFLRTEIEE